MKYKEIPKDKDFVERFKLRFSKLTKTHDGCIFWDGAKMMQGYGTISKNKIRYLAHRVSYTVFKKTILDGLVLDHKCSNRLCVNPEHLQETTIRRNIDLAFERNPELKKGNKGQSLLLSRGFCKHGHIISSLDDLYNNPWKGKNNRKCKKCRGKNKSKYNSNYYCGTKKLTMGVCLHGHTIKSTEDLTKTGKCKQCRKIWNTRYNEKVGLEKMRKYNREYARKRKLNMLE
jgi:hypothetical protein